MKKWIALILALMMCLPMAGCGKSEAVKAVEAMLKALPEFTEESKAAYFEANAVYQALSEEEQGKVKGRKKFYAQLDPYFTESMVGEWYPFDLNLQEKVTFDHPRYGIVLRDDGTAFMEHPFGDNENGRWAVENGILIVSGFTQISTENNGCSYVDDCYPMDIMTDSGTERLKLKFGEHWSYMRLEDYRAEFSKVVKIVDLSVENIADYAWVDHIREYETDEFGAHTGWVYDVYYLRSKLYDEGWYYLSCDDDLAIELCSPAHDFVVVNLESGRETPNHHDSTVQTIVHSPFSINVGDHFLKRTDRWEAADSPAAEDHTFGRTKGKIYYINEKYIKEVIMNEYECRDLVLDVETYPFFGYGYLNTGIWEEENQLY